LKSDLLFNCYKILLSVYNGGARAGRALYDNGGDKEAAIVYGVLERDVTLDYIVGKLVSKSPKPKVTVLLKLGIFLYRYSDMPQYAAADQTVELAKKAGLAGVSGFINAVVRASGGVDTEAIADGELYLSVKYSVPLFYVRKLAEYPQGAEAVLRARPQKLTHIRRNARLISEQDFDAAAAGYLKSPAGFYADADFLSRYGKDSRFIVQSEGSVAVAYACADRLAPERVLDACAAPGGKAVYISERYPDSQITAWDIHLHRVALTEKYAAACGASNIRAEVRDASADAPEYHEAFDLALCDVPCTGSGVAYSKPDIFLNMTEDGLRNLAQIQSAILSAVAKYVKRGGVLVYSTCSLIPDENEGVADAFIAAHPEYAYEPLDTFYPEYADNAGKITFFPVEGGREGFFAARFRKL